MFDLIRLFNSISRLALASRIGIKRKKIDIQKGKVRERWPAKREKEAFFFFCLLIKNLYTSGGEIQEVSVVY